MAWVGGNCHGGGPWTGDLGIFRLRVPWLPVHGPTAKECNVCRSTVLPACCLTVGPTRESFQRRICTTKAGCCGSCWTGLPASQASSMTLSSLRTIDGIPRRYCQLSSAARCESSVVGAGIPTFGADLFSSVTPAIDSMPLLTLRARRRRFRPWGLGSRADCNWSIERPSICNLEGRCHRSRNLLRSLDKSWTKE